MTRGASTKYPISSGASTTSTVFFASIEKIVGKKGSKKFSRNFAPRGKTDSLWSQANEKKKKNENFLTEAPEKPLLRPLAIYRSRITTGRRELKRCAAIYPAI